MKWVERLISRPSRLRSPRFALPDRSTDRPRPTGSPARPPTRSVRPRPRPRPCSITCFALAPTSAGSQSLAGARPTPHAHTGRPWRFEQPDVARVAQAARPGFPGRAGLLPDRVQWQCPAVVLRVVELAIVLCPLTIPP